MPSKLTRSAVQSLGLHSWSNSSAAHSQSRMEWRWEFASLQHPCILVTPATHHVTMSCDCHVTTMSCDHKVHPKNYAQLCCGELSAILTIFFRVTSLALVQSYVCPSVGEVTQKNMDISKLNQLTKNWQFTPNKKKKNYMHIDSNILKVAILIILEK